MGRPRTKSDDELLDAVLRVIEREGVGGVTFAAVGREAGIAASSLHARFGSKRALLLATAARLEPRRARPDLPPLEAIEELLVRSVAAMADRETWLNQFSWLQLDLGDPDFGAHAQRWVLAMRGQLAELLRAAGCDERAAATVFAAQQGAMMLWALDREGELTERVREAVRAVLR